jgi:hypothetical protein
LGIRDRSCVYLHQFLGGGTRNSPESSLGSSASRNSAMPVLARVRVALELFSGGPKSGLKTKGRTVWCWIFAGNSCH